MSDAYATSKLAAHAEVLKDMREGGAGKLLTIHLMPQNLCNQRCAFCSYRLPDNKNSEDFNEKAHIPWPEMVGLLDDFEDMGVLGIEVTGGGEPLAYPHCDDLWSDLSRRPFDTALVTNGTLMGERAELISRKLKWARVSIDAATPESYVAVRKCPASHFEKAWEAVRQLRKHAPDDPEYRLGVGFVLCNENITEVYDFVKMAKESGADNTRLGVTYSDQGVDFYHDKDLLKQAVNDSIRAKADFDDESFQVHNLIPVRAWEVAHPYQDYRRCPTKDLLCVVEGTCAVYTCCTFAGSLKGKYGHFNEHADGFKGLWEEHAAMRKYFDASQYCTVSCLYRERNLAMNELIDASDEPPAQDHVHTSFI